MMKSWSVEIHKQASKLLTFWDTFEWGLWFGGHLLYSCNGIYHLCSRDGSWLGAEMCTEQAKGSRRFWGDFETLQMRTRLEEMLGLRALACVAEVRLRLQRVSLRNTMDKVVCRIELASLSAGKRGGEELLRSCLVTPLIGYEADAARVVEHLIACGAAVSVEGPLEMLLIHTECKPQKYTLRPAFDLTTDTPAREAAGRIVRSFLEIANRNLPGILSDLDTEFLHDYRICLRKIRSLLSLVKDLYPVEETERIRRILGDLARQTNRLRDLDVYLLARDEYAGFLPPFLRSSLDGMFEAFSSERSMELRNVTSKIRTPSYQAHLRELDDYFREGAVHSTAPSSYAPVGPVVFRRIFRLYSKICRIAAAVDAATPDETIHQIRIECKKLRYLMEFFSEIIPGKEGAHLLALLRRLQNRLGEFNDASVQQESLLVYGQQKKPVNEAALALGGLISSLYHRQKEARGDIIEALENFSDASTAALFRSTFKQPAPIRSTAVKRTLQ